MRIALRACYHPDKGAIVIKKLADLQKLHESTGEYNKTVKFDDHPASIERYEHLLQLYEELPEEEKHRCKPFMEVLQYSAPGMKRTIFSK